MLPGDARIKLMTGELTEAQVPLVNATYERLGMPPIVRSVTPLEASNLKANQQKCGACGKPQILKIPAKEYLGRPFVVFSACQPSSFAPSGLWMFCTVGLVT